MKHETLYAIIVTDPFFGPSVLIDDNLKTLVSRIAGEWFEDPHGFRELHNMTYKEARETVERELKLA